MRTVSHLIAVLVPACVLVLGCAGIGPTESGSPPASGAPATSVASSTVQSSPSADVPMTIAPTPTANAATTPTPTPTPTTAPTAPPTATPAATPKPARVKSFAASDTVIDCNVEPEPYQVHLEWSIARATGVTISIDGPGIYDSFAGETGSADVPFACGEPKHTYTLSTTGGDGAAASQTVTVKRAKPAFVEGDTSVPGLTTNVQCTSPINRILYWHVENASGVKIESGGVVLGTYDGVASNVQVPFDCTVSDTQTYHLTTIAKYGPQATFDVETFYNYQPF